MSHITRPRRLHSGRLGMMSLLAIGLLTLMLALAACGTPQPPRATIYGASQGGILYALNAQDGRMRWSYRTVNSVFGGALTRPVFVNGTIYAASSAGGLILYLLDAKDGALRSRIILNTTPLIPLQPLIVNDVLYLVAFDANADKSFTTFVYALRTQDGSLLWQHQAQGYPTGNLALANGLIYLALGEQSSGSLITLDASTGSPRWQADVPSLAHSGPVIVDGLVVLSDESALYALRADTGAFVWSYSLSITPYGGNPFAAADGTIYVSGRDGSLVALRVRDGSVRWRVHLEQVGYMPVLAQGVIYAAPVEGDHPLYGLRASDGSILWQFHSLESSCEGGIGATVLGQVVYCAGYDGGNLAILALSVNDGTLIRSYTLPVVLYSTYPVVIGPSA